MRKKNKKSLYLGIAHGEKFSSKVFYVLMRGFKFRVICFLSSLWMVGCLTGGGNGENKDPNENTNKTTETIEPDYSKREVVIKNSFVFEVNDSTLSQTEFIPQCTDTGLSYRPVGYEQYFNINAGVMSLWSQNSCNAWVYHGEASQGFTGTWYSENSETGPIPEGFDVSSGCDSVVPIDSFTAIEVRETYTFEGDSLFTEISSQLCELASFRDWVVFEEFNFLYDVFIDSIPDISNALSLIWDRLSYQDIDCKSYQLSFRTRKALVTNHYQLNTANEVIGEHYEFEYSNQSCIADISYLEVPDCEGVNPWVEFLACVFLTDFFPLESALEELESEGQTAVRKKTKSIASIPPKYSAPARIFHKFSL